MYDVINAALLFYTNKTTFFFIFSYFGAINAISNSGIL